MVDSLVDELRPIEAGPGSKLLAALAGDGPAPPKQVQAELGAMLAIERFGLPPALVAAFKYLASLHNPAFYEKERLRLSTWNTPRFVRCHQETLDRLVLPRGLLADVRAERESRVFKFNPSQRLRALFGWSSTYRGPL